MASSPSTAKPAIRRGAGAKLYSPRTASAPILLLLGRRLDIPTQRHNRLLRSLATDDKKPLISTSRRSLVLLLFPFIVSSPVTASPPVQGGDLERYTDGAEGFTLLKPSSWAKVEKAGATALFEEEGKGSNSIGVVVNPVRLGSLRDFGTPQFVADKLIQAERRKESTMDAKVITVAERLGHDGLPVYEFEYTVDSTRGGMKRIFSAAFVASRKLYLLNIAYSDRLEKPLDSQTRMVLEQVLHSFDTA